MTSQEAEELRKKIADALNPIKEKDGLIIMAFTFNESRGLYMLEGLARKVLQNQGDFDIYDEIGGWTARDYFAAKGSFHALNGGDKNE